MSTTHPPHTCFLLPSPHQVGGSFGIFYGYVGVIGLAIYLVLRWFKAGISLASVWCIYGGLGLGGVSLRSALLLCSLPACRWRWAGRIHTSRAV